ncbi:MAG TPA: hypothetical protein VLA79_14565, partial [Polyangia bacterium]|nr:hypothetical protein [Polyangia bacterium]
MLAVAGLALALTLPLRADWSNLLPAHERSVRDLENLQSRTTSLGLVLCAVASGSPTLREKGAQLLASRIRQIDPSVVADVVVDDSAARRYFADHRFLFAPLADLEAARDVLSARIRRAHLAANPLYVSLDDERDVSQEKAQEDRTIESLRHRLDEADKTAQPRAMVSKDGKTQILVVQAAFPSASVTQGERLV